MSHFLTALALPIALLASPTGSTMPVASAATTPFGENHYEWDGELKGLNTIDLTYNFFLTDFDRYDFVFTAAGNGTNTLTVKIQVRLLDGRWSDKVVRHLKPGETKSGTFTVTNQRPGDEIYRVRMSKKLGTREIDYTVDLFKQP